MKLDDTDKKVLDILQTNANITNAQLASELGISPAAMLERVKRLENSGIIKRYVALVDPEKVGKRTMAFIAISLAVHHLNSIDTIREEISKLSEVLECYHVAGEEDFMLKVAIRDIQEYEHFMFGKLTKINGINKIKTTFIVSTVKYDTKFNIDNGSISGD
ncbi:MAG: Lrp/AsnC family transcriptional regulator [Clostridiales bacterium]